MDWIIDRRRPGSAEEVLADLARHLRRHATADARIDAAVEQARTALAGLADQAGPADVDGHTPVRLHLDWRAGRPTVALGTLTRADLSEARLPQGVALSAAERARLARVDVEQQTQLTLGLERRVRETFDDGPPPMPRLHTDPRTDGVASVAVALAAAAEAHPTAGPEQTASMAGAALADVVADPQPPRDGEAAARLVVEAHRLLGSDAHLVAHDGRVAEVAVSRCPFGSGASGTSLCHVSTGLAGRIAARVEGRATVQLTEAIAAGDAECRLRIWLGSPSEDVRGENHRWPPGTGVADTPAPHLDLSVNLPREGGSVPVVRRLAGQALRAFGVVDEHIDDVQLAITEACANVIDHAADTDTYEVKVELAANRCAITVVDRGGGFDATAVPDEVAHSAEEGRGLALMRALVDRVAFDSEPQAGAVVHMVKQLEYDPAHPLRQRLDGA